MMRRMSSSKKSPIQQQLQQVKVLYDQGKDEHSKGLYAEAALSFGKAIDIQEGALGKYHFDTIKSYWRHGRSLCLTRDPENDHATLQAFQRALRMADSTFQDRRTYDRLWKEVESCWREAHPSDNDNDAAAEIMKQLAEILELEKQADAACKNKQVEESVERYQRALDIQDALLGGDSLDGADLRCKLAVQLIRHGDLTQAEHELQAAQDCYVQRLGEHHPATLGAKAGMRNATKRLARKEASFKRKRWFNASLSSIGASTASKTARA